MPFLLANALSRKPLLVSIHSMFVSLHHTASPCVFFWGIGTLFQEKWTLPHLFTAPVYRTCIITYHRVYSFSLHQSKYKRYLIKSKYIRYYFFTTNPVPPHQPWAFHPPRWVSYIPPPQTKCLPLKSRKSRNSRTPSAGRAASGPPPWGIPESFGYPFF